MFTEHASGQRQPLQSSSILLWKGLFVIQNTNFQKMFEVYMSKFGMLNCLKGHITIKVLQKMAKINSESSKIGK